MARMGGRRHLKAVAAPFYYPILRKKYKWTIKPSPGPHPIHASLPLAIVLRELMKIADTSGEARKVISEGKIAVDGRVVKNYKFPIGFFDVISIIPTNEFYRVIPKPTVFIDVISISEEEAWIKPLRIENKTTVKKGDLQLNLYGGYNILLRKEDIDKKGINYKTFDTVIISLKDKSIIDHIPLQEGSLAIVVGGRNVGRIGRIVKIQKGMRAYRSLVTLEDANKHLFQTSLNHIYVIGRDKPVIKLLGDQ